MISKSYRFEEFSEAAKGIYTRPRGICLGVVTVLCFCLVVNSSWQATPDSALYLELGESIARGVGYQFNGEQHTYVPPGYPVMVAAVAYVFGESFRTYRMLMALLGLLTALAGYLLVLRICGRDAAFLCGGLFALNHVLLHNSTYTTSDVPFALVSLLGLHMVVSAAAPQRGILCIILAGLTIGLAPLVRINGWGLAPAAAFFLFFEWRDDARLQRIFRLLIFLLIALAPGVLWEAHKASFPGSFHEGTYINALGGRDIATQVGIILKSMWEYVQETNYALAGISVKTGLLEMILPALSLLGMGIAVWRRDRLFAPLVAIQYCGLFFAPAGSRYLILLIPILYVFLSLGLIRLSKWIGGRRGFAAAWFPTPRRLLVGCFAVLALLNVGHDTVTIFHARTPLEANGAQSARDLPFFEAARWLRHQPGEGAVLSMHPRVLRYLSHRPTIDLVRSGVPEHQAWIEDQDDIIQLVLSRKPEFFFSDQANLRRFDRTVAAIQSLGLKLEEIPGSVHSERFRLWRICPTASGC